MSSQDITSLEQDEEITRQVRKFEICSVQDVIEGNNEFQTLLELEFTVIQDPQNRLSCLKKLKNSILEQIFTLKLVGTVHGRKILSKNNDFEFMISGNHIV